MSARRNLLAATPVYPWERVAPLRQKAARHPDGLIDLSIGSPVDSTPVAIQGALAAAADAPGYPSAAGTPELRAAMVDWYRRRRGIDYLDDGQVVATNGSKEFIALLPFWLGLGPGDVVVQPIVHYPTYQVGAELVGAAVVSEDDPARWPAETKLIWLNSPGNPDGVVHELDYLAAAVARARELGAVLVQDECYIELGWGRWETDSIPSILDPRLTGGEPAGLLSCYSLSKQSNLAGYRAALVAGCRTLVAGLVNVRKQAGLGLPGPIQAAMVAALADDADVAVQKARYRSRRELLLPAVERWGVEISASEAGLYLWGTAHEDGWTTLDRLAEIGIVAGPGEFYGDESRDFVRFSITASDAGVAQAAERLSR